MAGLRTENHCGGFEDIIEYHCGGFANRAPLEWVSRYKYTTSVGLLIEYHWSGFADRVYHRSGFADKVPLEWVC